VRLAPGQKLRAGPGIGPPRVRVADVGGGELDIAPARILADIGDQRRHDLRGGRSG